MAPLYFKHIRLNQITLLELLLMTNHLMFNLSNPANNYFKIKTDQESTLKIYNSLGRLIANRKNNK